MVRSVPYGKGLKIGLDRVVPLDKFRLDQDLELGGTDLDSRFGQLYDQRVHVEIVP
ncbi:hypothetical protein GCM10007962_31740 [Yeosuana aromativorans]|uniref:Uncharacterized protein n=1 Tax=Yeosuana aromativorans TaxID=288019 RepID=A0A8J3BVE2_9FLAO|nr:hypothetical protein GCM10007962_31740 [Yeosuana aromativorans]